MFIMTKKKPKINLETIANEGKRLAINEASDKETDLSKKVPMWVQAYVSEKYGEEQAEATYEILRRDPVSITPLILQATKKHEKSLITEVRKNPKTVAKGLDENYAIGIASKFFGNENYKTLKEAIEQNGDIKGAFAGAFEGELWAATVAGAIPEAVKGAATGYFQRATQREILKNLCDGEGNFNSEKTATYVSKGITSQNQETRDNSYKELGLMYAQAKMQS